MRGRRGTALIFFVLFGLVRAAVPGLGQQAEDGGEDAFGSLHRSLLVPGWGQMAEHRYVEGIVFLAADVVCLVNILSLNHKGNAAYERYREAAGVDEAVEFRRRTEDYDTRRNKFLLAAAGLWVVNLIDIYVIVKNKKTEDKRLKIEIGRSEDSLLAVSLSYRF